ncbi:M4 family metallopeptidase [Kribbella sp. WER1]
MATPTCFFVPPHITDHIARSAQRQGREQNAVRGAIADQALRQQRKSATYATLQTLTQPQPGKSDIAIYDDQNQWNVNVQLVRGPDDPPVAGANVNAAYDALAATRKFYHDVLGRESIDNAGLTIDGNVNFGVQYDNAFWDGSEMVFGNGDNVIFKDFTNDVDVPGHELTHGVTQYTAGLGYTDQTGALNEATSDIMGACIDQYVSGQDAGTFNWLIGEGVMADDLYGEAIRSMAHPGTAYDDPLLGKDPQPDSMAGYVPNGDPHVNSGIINRVFYLIATDLGSFPAAKLWYATLQNLWPTAVFADTAHVASEMARILARDGVVARQAPQTVRAAFHEVGIS